MSGYWSVQFRNFVKEVRTYQVYSTFLDITDRHKIEEEFKALNQQLQASEQQLQAANQQLQASEQQLRAANQQLRANEQELIAAKEESERNEKYYHTIINNMGDPVL